MNKKIWIVVGVIATIVVIVIAFFIWRISVRNSIITLDQNVDEAWGNVENQYQRRLDLIPNLVATVEGYATHESTTFMNVTEARSGLKTAYNNAKGTLSDEAPENLQKFQQAQADLNRQLGLYINAVHEAYPDLKANTNFLDLQEQLEGTENRIATERTRYNEAVKEYNAKILRFPGSMFASGFGKRSMFSADPGAERAPKVSFGNSGNNDASNDDF